MAASSTQRTRGPCRMLAFVLLITASLLNGEYLKRKEKRKRLMQRWSTFERLYGRMEGGREGQEGAGAEECLFEWSLS